MLPLPPPPPPRSYVPQGPTLPSSPPALRRHNSLGGTTPPTDMPQAYPKSRVPGMWSPARAAVPPPTPSAKPPPAPVDLVPFPLRVVLLASDVDINLVPPSMLLDLSKAFEHGGFKAVLALQRGKQWTEPRHLPLPELCLLDPPEG